MEEHKNETRYFSCERCNLSGTGTHDCPYLKTNDRTYTQKELYQFVTEYSREAREEGFDAMVGDFVDWIASREEKIGEPECYCDLATTLGGSKWRYLCAIHRDKLCPICRRDGLAVMTDGSPCERHKQEGKTVLPAKLSIHSGQDVRDPDTMLDLLLDMQDAINTIVDYLKEKNL